MPLKGRGARDVDLVVFRENTEGIYVGMGGQFVAWHARRDRDQRRRPTTRKGVERLIRAGFEHARAHDKKRVHMADKSNAMRHAHELWYRVFFEVAAEYPGIEAKHVYVDALCLYLVQDPSAFEVIVTCNLFGDIVTDLGAPRCRAASAWRRAPICTRRRGSAGDAARGDIHEGVPVGVFEPVHGSAPPLAGRGRRQPCSRAC